MIQDSVCRYLRPTACLTVFGLLLAAGPLSSANAADEKLPGIVLDDAEAAFEGEWTKSTSTRPYFGEGYQHEGNTAKGQRKATFTTRVLENGFYHVLLSYTPGSNRASNVPVTVYASDGEATITVNQKTAPNIGSFVDLGEFEFKTDLDAVVTLDNKGTNGHVIVDGLVIVTPAEFKSVKKILKAIPQKVAAKPKKEEPPPEPTPEFKRNPAKGFAKTTADELNALLVEKIGAKPEHQISDEVFLRRVTLDIAGRQPTMEELEAFLADNSKTKRAAAVDRLLESEDYGANWGNYWSDVVGSRQQQPELTFHNYDPYKEWLADQFNQGTGWDEMVFQMLTARGKVGDNPAGTFIAFHQADEKKLAGETSRVFLSVQIACAECHDHPFADMPTETFHGMAAFVVRAEAKIPWNDSSKIELKSKDKGEHKVPGQKEELRPVALGNIDSIDGSAEYELGMSDLDRRAALAEWIVDANNPFFARAYVNRVFARLMGRGFYEPVDELGQLAEEPILQDVHERLAEHFVATGYDHKDIVRLLTNTPVYQRSIVAPESMEHPLAAAKVKKLRGDEVFDSLVTAIALPNVKPEIEKASGAVRFPVPPKSTRDLVNEAFGYDPSLKDDLLVRTMKQAMFMMNNEQLQGQINAGAESETFLAKMLAAENDNQQVAKKLYHAVLARSPSEKELGIVMAHVNQIGERGPAFEDVLWSLINSAEFTTRR